MFATVIFFVSCSFSIIIFTLFWSLVSPLVLFLFLSVFGKKEKNEEGKKKKTHPPTHTHKNHNTGEEDGGGPNNDCVIYFLHSSVHFDLWVRYKYMKEAVL
eukprot:TRINITY_DN1118_c0_g1_i9.p2 TRINITY_DN1118_c0_g1~~TRINITY_DN1118_c0_g1_i9.p2  ORF type:complete len:101 (-),score=0.75 TRINITY_DN1118_c0_g1_i9:1558-1860(-)